MVQDEERRRALQELTGANDFINEAPVFLVFLADLSRQGAIAAELSVPAAGLEYQEALLVATVDAALAAQNAVVAAESLGLGTCYVGGIRTHVLEVARLLQLPRFCYPVVGMALGHPAADAPGGVRPRLPLDAVRHFETYDENASLGGVCDLEDANARYMATWGKPDASWMQGAARRWQDESGLGGRADNRAKIAELGFLDR